MNKVELDDLKQFILRTVSGVEVRIFDDLKQYIDARLSQTEQTLTVKIEALDQKIDGGFAGVGDAIEQMNTEADKTHASFERRLLKAGA